MRDDRATVPVRIREHAGLQQGKIGVVATVERQRFDRARTDQIAQLRARRVDHWRSLDDGDGLLQTGHLQDKVEGDCLGHASVRSPLERFEARHLGPQFVIAGRKARDDEAAFGAGHVRAATARSRRS